MEMPKPTGSCPRCGYGLWRDETNCTHIEWGDTIDCSTKAHLEAAKAKRLAKCGIGKNRHNTTGSKDESK